MRNGILSKCFAALFLAALAPQANASEGTGLQLEVLQGQILVDQGKGFGLATPGMELTSGNRLMLLKGAAGILSSATTGCVLSLRQPGAFVVPDLAQCEAGKAAVLTSNIVIEPANGVYEPVLLEPPPPPVGAAGITSVVAGGTFVAAVAASFAWTQLSDADEKEEAPVSAY